MLPILLLGAAGALVWWLLSERPKGIYALWAKRYQDGWEIYILSDYRKSQAKNEKPLDDLLSGSDLDKKKAGDIENATSFRRWEFVALNKLEEKVYHGFLSSRFDVLDREAVCDVIKEYLELPEERWVGKDKGILRDPLRFMTVRRFTGTYIPLQSLERLKDRVQNWL